MDWYRFFLCLYRYCTVFRYHNAGDGVTASQLKFDARSIYFSTCHSQTHVTWMSYHPPRKNRVDSTLSALNMGYSCIDMYRMYITMYMYVYMYNVYYIFVLNI